jgi:MFS family permease
MEPSSSGQSDIDSGNALATQPEATPKLPRDVWAISVTSLFSDWSYEMILPVLPFFLIFSLAATPFLVGLIDGAAQFAQSGIQLVSGERWSQGTGRKARASYGYLTMVVCHGLIALAVVWPEVLALRVGAWLGRGSRQPIKKAILANATSAKNQGIAFGLEQALDSAGAVLGTVTAVVLLLVGGLGAFRTIFAISVIPGLIAVAVLLLFVKDRASRIASRRGGRPRIPWREFPASFRLFILAEVVFGLGYFSILLALLRVGENLLPSSGASRVEAVVAALLLYLLYNLIFTGLSYPVGRWADRSPGLGLVAVSFGLFAVVDLLLIGQTGLVGGVLAFTVAGVQVGLHGVTESAWVARRMPAALIGPAFGWLGMVQGFAILAGSLLVGGLWTYVSAPLAFGVSAVLSIAGAALLVPLLIRTGTRKSGSATTP